MGVTVPVVNIAGNAATATKLSNDSGSAPSYGCRSWVNFNGTGTVSIRASGNVSSITDNGVGDYTVNFSTALPDANWLMSGTTGSEGTQWGTAGLNLKQKSNSWARVLMGYVSSVGGAATAFDYSDNHVAFFR